MPSGTSSPEAAPLRRSAPLPPLHGGNSFATTLINGIKQEDGSIKYLPIKAVADILGHTTTEITELYYVERDSTKLEGLTDEFNL